MVENASTMASTRWRKGGPVFLASAGEFVLLLLNPHCQFTVWRASNNRLIFIEKLNISVFQSSKNHAQTVARPLLLISFSWILEAPVQG